MIGANILPSRVLRPVDKYAVERAFGVIQSLLFEFLPGYQGVDVADRGADPEGDAVLTLAEMEHLVAAWVVRYWQNRQLGEYAPAWDPGGRHSPNSLFAAAMGQGGFSLQIPPASLYYELMPASFVKVQGKRGVKIGGLWYDDPALDPCRGASGPVEGRAQHRQIIYYDTPPPGAAPCAALLTLAADILASPGPRSLGQAVGHLAVQAAPAFRRWARWFLAGDGYCSPALRAAAGPAVGARHVIREAAAADPGRLHPPPRPESQYSITHVPAYLPAAWHEEYLAPLASLAPEQLLRRAAALRLARTCTAAAFPQLGELLGIPPGSAKSKVKTVHGRLEAADRQAEFEAAIGALVAMLGARAARTDYGSRRQALHGWVISPAQWTQMTASLPAHREAHADWGERKRMLASAWVWTRVTGGEHLFAPAVMTDLAAPEASSPEAATA